MHKITYYFGLLSLVLTSFAYLSNTVLATVGGPTYLERLSYSKEENAVYYLKNDQGGRGCPPEIIKINLVVKEAAAVMPCEVIEQTYYKQDGFDSAGYDAFMQNTFAALESLPAIDLAKNNISVEVSYVGEHKFDEENISADFRATVFQNNEQKGVIDFVGCYKDQPHVFRGYQISNLQHLALVVSRVGDCFEGEYTKEDVSIIDRVYFQDTNPVGPSNAYSGSQVQRGNLVAWAQDEKSGESVASQDIIQNLDREWIWGVGIFIIGLVLGYALKRQKQV